MRIAIDIRHLCAKYPSGIGYYTKEIVERLVQKTDLYITLFASGSRKTLNHIAPLFQNVNSNITLHYLNTSNRILNTQFFTKRITLDDIIASPVDLWFFPNIHFIQTKKPYIITAHDLSFFLFPEYYAPKARLWHKLVQPKRLFSQAQHIIPVSSSTKEDLHHVFHIENQRMTTIPLAGDISFCIKKEPSDNHILRAYGIHTPYFLMLSTLEPRKNHLGMIQAYERWRKMTSENISLVIAGKYSYKAHRIIRAINKSPYKKNIHILNYIAHKDRAILLRHAKALFFPSFYEGFALPVREALQSGIPVLTSSLSAMLEHTGPTVLHVHPWHIQEIADGISELLHLPQNKKPDSFTRTWDHVAQETKEVLLRYL